VEQFQINIAKLQNKVSSSQPFSMLKKYILLRNQGYNETFFVNKFFSRKIKVSKAGAAVNLTFIQRSSIEN
jgi:hypothetical protein